MSFQHKSFWISRDGGCITDGEVSYDNSSRIEPKRGHQWFVDTSAPELFGNKKQAIETVDSRPLLGGSDVNIPPWQSSSSFQSVPGQFSDCLFGSDTVGTVSMTDRNIPSFGGVDMSIGLKDLNGQYGSDSSMGLSISHTIDDPAGYISYGGLRKVKINEVRDSSNHTSAYLGHSYSGGDNTAISVGGTYDKDDGNAMSMGPTYGNGYENTITIGPTFSKADGSFILMGQSFKKGDGNFMSIGHNYNKGEENILSMSWPFDKAGTNFITMGPPSEKGDRNIMSMATSYGQGHENFIAMGSTYDKENESFISVGRSCGKGGNNIISIGATYDKGDSSMPSLGSGQDKGDSSNLSMGQNYNSNDSNTISFGGFHDEPETNPSGSLISSYDALLGDQNSALTPEVLVQKDSVQSNAKPLINNASKSNSKTDAAGKNKEPKTSKKAPPNNFPANVKSLLSTGILDGVTVKYVSWSREKTVKGSIKGTGYVCGCKDCNFNKTLNAYEFERHANCKTKHPNNHIYFDNGKTIYAVVQELKSTPQEMLFDAIQTVTGSEVNQKNFRIWKASYQAATRELQRIYGDDEVTVPS